jgi:2-polyprenyl-3-methyl-5-hydroxy-6-metoxy-1,4-benzoquinol methylase
MSSKKNSKLENGVYFGNYYDKYSSKNVVFKILMSNFENRLFKNIEFVNPKIIHEVGCGEGYWIRKLSRKGFNITGSDFSSKSIDYAIEMAVKEGLKSNLFNVSDIYNINNCKFENDLVLCCEVLEHLEYPEMALEKLQLFVNDFVIFSVPKEPLWRFLNVMRFSYLRNWGNTPGHLNHWSTSNFITLVSKYFEVVNVYTPLPWTMVLCKNVKNKFDR